MFWPGVGLQPAPGSSSHSCTASPASTSSVTLDVDDPPGNEVVKVCTTVPAGSISATTSSSTNTPLSNRVTTTFVAGAQPLFWSVYVTVMSGQLRRTVASVRFTLGSGSKAPSAPQRLS